MTPDEVIRELEQLGVKISRETLRRWTNAGLVPEPIRGSRGRGQGRFTDYPVDTSWEAFAAWHLLRDCSINQVATVSKKARLYLAEFCYYTLPVNIESVRDILSNEGEDNDSSFDFAEVVDELVFRWIMYRVKAAKKIPLSIPISIRIYFDYFWTEKEWMSFFNDEISVIPNVVYDEKIKQKLYASWDINITIYEKGNLGDLIIDNDLLETEEKRIEFFKKQTPDGEIVVKDNNELNITVYLRTKNGYWYKHWFNKP